MNYICVYLQILSQQTLQNIDNCYDKQTKLTLNKVQHQFILKLKPINSVQCNKFQGDVQFHLIVSDNAINKDLSTLVTGFNYDTTHNIEFDIPIAIALTNYIDEHFILIKIVTLSHITQITVQNFEEVRSDLSSCFQSLQVVIDGSQTIIEMCPTSLCLQQFVLKNMNVKSFVQEVVLLIDKYSFDLNVDQFISQYQNQQCHSEKVEVDDIQMQKIQEVSFATSFLNIVLKQGKRKASLRYKVNVDNSKVSDVFVNKFAYMYHYGNDTGYQILFDYKLAQLNLVLQKLDMLGYDRIEQRLTSQVTEDVTYKKVNHTISWSISKFDETQRSIKFSCNSVVGEQKQVCLKMLYNDYNTYYSSPTIYNYDILFYFQDKLIYLMKAANCIPVYTCWNYGVAVLYKDMLQMQLTRNHYCDSYTEYYDYSNISTRIIINNAYPVYEQIVYRYVPMMNSTNVNIFNWSCTEIDCSKIFLNTSIQFEYNCTASSVFVEKYILDKIFDGREPPVTINVGLLTGSTLTLITIIVLMFQWRKMKETVRNYTGDLFMKRKTEGEKLIEELEKVLKKRKIE
ncbi:Conserved_hypothetical protein [Hexamita inflata]|uniref:Transmembrane protein n=1 Tax=Hexamita inflata TaxID=28002 RepID=A0AA86UFR6_9EUKA|nr:Conserved hypothetical protein [Hexamita inflata]